MNSSHFADRYPGQELIDSWLGADAEMTCGKVTANGSCGDAAEVAYQLIDKQDRGTGAWLAACRLHRRALAEIAGVREVPIDGDTGERGDGEHATRAGGPG